MRKILGILSILCVCGLTTASFVQSAPLNKEANLNASRSTVLEGTLMKIDGEFFFIMDKMGKEQRVHVDKSTLILGKIQPGSKVKAEVTDDGHVSALSKVGS